MKKEDLRIGNILNYHTAEGDILPAVIDWQDIKWISEDEIGFNLFHSGMLLTEEILINCGFIMEDEAVSEYSLGNLTLIKLRLGVDGRERFELLSHEFIPNLNYIHELQNVYFALTNKELNVKI